MEEKVKMVFRRLIPVPKWKKYHDWPTEAGLRWLIYRADSNGFKKVIKRCNGRILIDEAEFFRWVDEKNLEN